MVLCAAIPLADMFTHRFENTPALLNIIDWFASVVVARCEPAIFQYCVVLAVEAIPELAAWHNVLDISPHYSFSSVPLG
jgi:hypothetical protein